MTRRDGNAELSQLLRKVHGQAPARLEPLFDRHGVEASEGVDALVEEIRLDGANTLASIIRGWEGVDYSEIVCDAAKTLKVKVVKDDDHVTVEDKILSQLFREHYTVHATEEERAEIDGILQVHGVKQTSWSAGGALLTALISTVGQEVTKQVIKKALKVVAGRSAARVASFAVPILGATMAALTVVDLAGPAFRKTVPTVIDVAILRVEFG